MSRVPSRRLVVRRAYRVSATGRTCWSQRRFQSGQVISASLNYEEIFGPRSIYESAQQKEKVLSLSYDDILRLPTNSDLLSAKEHRNGSGNDLFIISKIMRRAPKLSDAGTSETRLSVARRLCLASALQGHEAATLFWSEETLRSPKTTSIERDQAMRLLTTLAKQKVGKANYLIGNELFSLKQEKNAMRAYRLAGEQGVAEAFTKLGRIMRYQGHQKQSEEAFQLAAEMNEPNALFMMSTFTKDPTKRLQYLQKSASGGKEEAAHNLGEHYRRTGQFDLAQEYLELAASKGFQVSQINLASLLREQKNYKLAEKWYLHAVQAGGEVGQHAMDSLTLMRASPEYLKQESRFCTIM